ncbi:MAG: MFS transporter [Candidatus Omnitrophica bacterium]|nr:MFS transporter [Candidatus Omnitrophota bacterium]
MKIKGLFRGLNKNIIVLSVTSFFTDISSEMLYPIIPIFLTSVIGVPMSILGLIEGIAESAASLLKALSGWYSDLFRKRQPFITIGYFLSALGKLFLFFAYTWPVVLVARFIDRFGKGVRTSPRDALLADSVAVEYRGKAFGFHRAFDTLGACLGPLFALWLLVALKGNLRTIFLIAFIPAILSVITLILFLKEKKPVHLAGAVTLNRPGLKKLFSPGLGVVFKRFILISSIFAIGNSSDAFLIMRAKNVGFSIPFVILAYVVYNVSYSALSFPFGILSDKIKRKWVIIGGFSIFALVYFGFARFANQSTVWILFFIYGFYMAMTDGVSKAFISDVVPQDSRATAIGIYYCVTGLLTLFASIIAGLLWSYVAVSAPFIYGAVLAALAALLCVFLL